MSASFLDKLLARIDKIDPARLQVYFERLRREWKMQETIFTTIQEGVIVLDAQGNLIDANPASERLLSFKAQQLRGKKMDRYLAEFDISTLIERNSENIRGESKSWSHLLSHEIEITYPEPRVLNVYALPLQGAEDADEPCVLVILRDVTSERREEASNLEGERTNAVKLLAAGVAHEIGNPLNALNIHLQLLSRELRAVDDKELRGDLTELVDVAKNEVTRLDGIIKQFLSAIRPSKPNLVSGDIATVLSETLDVMRVDIENRRIEVAVTAISAPPQVLIDPDQIKQVFFNLIKNAMEAMPDGGRLQIAISSDDSFLRIDFEDNGMGIPEEEIGRIFDAYHTTKAKGTGLGLMVVQRIVRDHGGQIEVSSKTGEGTRFRVYLPLATKRVRKLADSSMKV